jgi:selenocysteine lyase/cysteine desulfurase
MEELVAPQDFDRSSEHVWLNCAHQGPLPRVAAEEAREAIVWKTALYRLNDGLFSEVPLRLKRALGRLIHVPAEEIILGNSASYGLHLLANGIRWKSGDEVLLVKDDFPADILPWLALRDKGVRMRLIEPRGAVLQPDELEDYITKSTRLLCLTWIHSFNGHAVNAESLGQICRAKGVTFVLNCSQGLGARPFRVASNWADAVISVGFKWLCGPYGTGFCWMRPELCESLAYNQAYWLTELRAEDLQKAQIEYESQATHGAEKYDVFGTANFLNFKPWAAAVEYLLERGIEQIESHNDRLVSRLISGLDSAAYDLLSPREGKTRSSLLFISARDQSDNAGIYDALTQSGIHIAFRLGKLRFSPHLYNTDEDIDRALSVLHSRAHGDFLPI